MKSPFSQQLCLLTDTYRVKGLYFITVKGLYFITATVHAVHTKFYIKYDKNPQNYDRP